MSLASLERAILTDARILFKNPKLKLGDILEWSTGEVKPEDDTEVVAKLTGPGFGSVSVCIKKAHDKRA